jgi:hypothetical protein
MIRDQKKIRCKDFWNINECITSKKIYKEKTKKMNRVLSGLLKNKCSTVIGNILTFLKISGKPNNRKSQNNSN